MSEENIEDFNENVSEPEEYISSAKYLIELIQQDLNIGRKMTIAPRLARAVENLIGLQQIFPPPPPTPVVVSEDAARQYYIGDDYTVE